MMKHEANEHNESLANNTSSQERNSYDSRPLPYENIKQLRDKIMALTFNEDFASSLISKVREGIPEFEKTYYEVPGHEKLPFRAPLFTG